MRPSVEHSRLEVTTRCLWDLCFLAGSSRSSLGRARISGAGIERRGIGGGWVERLGERCGGWGLGGLGSVARGWIGACRGARSQAMVVHESGVRVVRSLLHSLVVVAAAARCSVA